MAGIKGISSVLKSKAIRVKNTSISNLKPQGSIQKTLKSGQVDADTFVKIGKKRVLSFSEKLKMRVNKLLESFIDTAHKTKFLK